MSEDPEAIRLGEHYNQVRTSLAEATLSWLKKTERSHDDVVEYTWGIATSFLEPGLNSIRDLVIEKAFLNKEVLFWKGLTLISLIVAVVAVVRLAIIP